MDELPDEVKTFLARAQRSHDVPDREVKQRVRASVNAALLIAPCAVPAANELFQTAELGTRGVWGTWGTSWKLGAGASLSAKLSAAVVATTLLGGGGWLLTRSESWVAPASQSAEHSVSTAPPSPKAKTSAPSVDLPAEGPASATKGPLPTREGLPMSVQVAPAISAESTSDRRLPALDERSAKAASSVVADRSELTLLVAASDALDAHNAELGLSLLSQHRRRFPRSAVDQERSGLLLVARCLQQGAGVRHEAAMFLKRFPGAVLTTRIRRACDL